MVGRKTATSTSIGCAKTVSDCTGSILLLWICEGTLIHKGDSGGGKSAQADSNPSKHGAAPVSLSRPPAKTQKVLQVKVAPAKVAEKLSKAATAKIVSDAKARHEFVGSREELMKPVGDRVRFLPSIPATDARPI